MKHTRRFLRSKRYLQIAADLEFWRMIYAIDAYLIEKGIICGLPYYQVRPAHVGFYCGLDRGGAETKPVTE